MERIDTSKVKVYVGSEKEENLINNLAEVVSSDNPFVEKGASKTLKHGDQEYLTTNPKYNWYKEVAQNKLGYKSGTDTIMERISAKGYRPRLDNKKYTYNYAKGREKYIYIAKDSNGIYLEEKEEKFKFGDGIKTRIPNSLSVGSFYLCLQGAGGNGGDCCALNRKGAQGGGSGAWGMLNITMPLDYKGFLCSVYITAEGCVILGNESLFDDYDSRYDIKLYAMFLVSCGIGGTSDNGWWEGLIYLFTGGLATIIVTALLPGDVNGGDGGKCSTINKQTWKFQDTGVLITLIKASNGVNGGGSKNRGSDIAQVSVDYDPDHASKKTYSGHSGGSAGGNQYVGLWVAQGGGGGGASLYSNGASGGKGASHNGSSAKIGAGGGAGGAGWGTSHGGTGGDACIEILF